MSDDKERNEGKSGEEFLSRWSRLKQQTRNPPEVETRPATPVSDPQAPPPELPPLDELTHDSDLHGFFHPKVDENLRRSALKKLFSDPHFNVMDGLDVYIDDYSKPDPLPAAMLARLKQAQKIIEWAKEKKEDTGAMSAALPAEHPPVGQAALPAAEQPEPAAPQAVVGPVDAAQENASAALSDRTV